MRRLLFVLGALALVAGCTEGRTQEPEQKKRPNVLIVVTDDERIESHIATPHTYTWFKGGTIFERAYVTTPHCCPSRASIFTGRYVHNHGVRHPGKIKQLHHQFTIQYVLSRAGYSTGFVGKFLNGWPLERKPPHFDRWTLGEGYNDAAFMVDGEKSRAEYGPRFVFETARDYIEEWERKDEQPWLLMLSPSAPHEPYAPLPPYETKTYPWSGNPASAETDLSDKPPYVRTHKYSEQYGEAIRESQFRTLRTLDDEFAATLDHLRETDELENTIAVYISDNGFMWAEHGLSGKAVPYTGAVRVPFYLRGPGVPTQVKDNIVANIDIAPTVFALAGIKTPYQVDGRNALTSDRKDLLLELFGKVSWNSVVTKTSQYVEYEDGFKEFYDLENDPFQLENNPAKAPPEMAARLKALTTCRGGSCP